MCGARLWFYPRQHGVSMSGRMRGFALPAADQRQEKTGLVKARVPINSVAVCPLHPHLFATGGGDAIGEYTVQASM